MEAQVAFSKEFMESYSRLPKKIQKKVRDFTEKFRQDPTQSGINFEKIHQAIDDKVRSARVDQAYRVIVIQPPKGDVYLCAWVDHHDEAYSWAARRRFDVNPTTGTFQLYEMVDAPPAMAEPEAASASVPAAVSSKSVATLFSGHDVETLLLAGIPEVLLPAVQAIVTEDDLDVLAPHLPVDASEMLYLLAAGYSLADAFEEAARSETAPATVDPDDFVSALTTSVAEQQFRILGDEEELQSMLDAPLEQWRTFLHPMQKKLVAMNANGPIRVLGGAGTGKTVVLMHRAKYLATKVFAGRDDKILVTTYTKNLAMELEANLRRLCGAAFEHIEVVNLHAWTDRFMKRLGQKSRVVDGGERRRLMELAVADVGVTEYAAAFLREEWDVVVQQQDVTDRDGYFTARRVGRGTRLSRKQRSEVWEVFRRYRELLQQSQRIEWQDLVREARLYLQKEGTGLPYCAVLADEIQDFTPNELRLLRAMIAPGPNDLFLVGDGHQRIYGPKATLGSCGIEIRGRSRRLKVNYRTTEQIRDVAVAVLEGIEIDDLDGGLDTMNGYRSIRSGPEPEIELFASEADEAKFLIDKIREWSKSVAPEEICIAARTGKLLDERYEPMLQNAGITTARVKREPESADKRGGVRLATMHRLKGLEFPCVLLVSVHDGTVPPYAVLTQEVDEVSRRERLQMERCLLYVAATRARDRLAIVGFGKACSLLLEPGVEIVKV